MSSPQVIAFLIDDVNEEKFASHGLTASRVHQVLENEYLILRNRRAATGLYLILGRDRGWRLFGYTNRTYL